MNVFEKHRLLMTMLDVFKTILSGLFVWMMIKQLFPNIDDHPSSTEFLAILVIGFAIGCVYVSILLATIDRKLREQG